MTPARMAAVAATTHHRAALDRVKAAKMDALNERLTSTIGRDQRRKRHRARIRFGEVVAEGHDVEAGDERQDKDSLQQTPNNKARGEERCGWRTRRPVHGIGLLALGFEDDRADRIDHHLKKGDVKRPEQQRQIKQQRCQGKAGDGHMDGQDLGHGLAQIVVDPPTEAHGGDYRGNIVVEQD